MSVLRNTKKEETTSKRGTQNIFVAWYIILSLIFILYVMYAYLQWVIYNSWVQQGNASGQQQWYEQAVVELMNQVGSECRSVALTAWDAQIDVINVACLDLVSPEASESN